MPARPVSPTASADGQLTGLLCRAVLCCAAQAKAELLAAKAATTNAEKAARAAREEERQRAWQQQQEANAQRAAEVAADRIKAKQAQVRAVMINREEEGWCHQPHRMSSKCQMMMMMSSQC
jgi:hypothetical protein